MSANYTGSNARPWVRLVPLVWWAYVWLRYQAITLSLLIYLAGAAGCVYQWGVYGLIGAGVLLVPTAVLVGFEIIFGRVLGPAFFGFIVTWIVENRGWDLLYDLLDLLARGT